MTGEPGPPEEALPFVAPCRQLAATTPLAWLRRGWSDMWSAPRQSLTYGSIVVLLSWALAYVTVQFGGYLELLSLVSGFILVAPLLAVGTYSISDQRERGLQPSLRRCFIGNAARVRQPDGVRADADGGVPGLGSRGFGHPHLLSDRTCSHEDWRQYWHFSASAAHRLDLRVDRILGSSFSLPMLMDRGPTRHGRRDQHQRRAAQQARHGGLGRPASCWRWHPASPCCCIGRERGANLVWIMVALGITLPLIGHATWHAYRETVDADQWPEQPDC
jgi:hypothetical protein